MAYSSPSNHMIFAASRSVPYMAYIAHVVTGVWCGEVGICHARVCTVLCLAGRVSFSTRAPVQSLTTSNQLMLISDAISPTIQFIVNLSLLTGTFPPPLKSSLVSPLLKTLS